MTTPATPTLRHWPEPETATTTSGLRIVCLNRPGPVVALRLTVRAGARHDARPGATHLLEHLLFRTPEGAEARRAIERRGGEIGANTTREQLSFDVVVLPEDLSTAVETLCRLVRARPRRTELEQEKPVVLREVAHEAEERRRLWQLQAEALYGVDHPLARPIIGTRASIEAMTAEDLAPTLRRLTAPNAALAAVGPVDVELVARLAEALVPDGELVLEDAAEPPIRPSFRRHEERSSQLLHLAVGWRFAGIVDPHLPALRIAEVILAHGSGSRLYERLRTRRRLAYRVSTVLIPYRDAGHLSAVTSCDPNHADLAERALVTELERLAARGPTWREVDEAKRQHVGQQARAFESSRRLAGYAATQLLWENAEALTQEPAIIDALEPADVRAACAALLRSGGPHAVASVGRLAKPA